MKRLLVVVAVETFALLASTPAWAIGGVVTPSTVMPGATVTVTGSVPIAVGECPVPGNVILQGIDLWANASGFIAGPYDATGHFSLRGMLSSTISLGPQSFLIRCAAKNEHLSAGAGQEIGGPAAAATFTVVGLAPTGGSIGPLSDATAAMISLTLLATGCAAALTRRRPASR